MSFEKLFSEVVNSGLCNSCGTCVSACPKDTLVIPLGEVGPEGVSDDCTDACTICYDVCPGRDLPYSEMEKMIFGRKRTQDPVEQMLGIHKYHLVTHSVDRKVHQTGVAGASVSTLLIHGLESGFLDAAIVAGYDSDKPWQVRPYVVTNRDGVLAAARSKYGVCSINTLLAEATKSLSVSIVWRRTTPWLRNI
jgi:coenzyme F420 hydrogenase subunit beta